MVHKIRVKGNTFLRQISFARIIVTRLRYMRFRYSLKQARDKKNPIRVVVGASGVAFKKWISTEQAWHDITVYDSWSQYFAPGTIDRIVAEHVLEHLTHVQTVQTLKNFYQFLNQNGCVRIAVPDGNHTSMEYIQNVRPGGSGRGADDHKILYTISSLTELFQSEGFSVDGLEYFDENGTFHSQNWDPEDGMIYRSYLHDKRNNKGKNAYSSIIIDAHKK